MKRFFLVCGLVIALLLSGCGSSASRVETLKSWSFQYNEGTSDSGYDMISYKLYDSAGYLVDSGNIYLSSLSAGDKFKDDSVVIYDITPGESYTFQLSEYSW